MKKLLNDWAVDATILGIKALAKAEELMGKGFDKADRVVNGSPVIEAEIIEEEEEEGYVNISLAEHGVCTEVARQLEAAFGRILWKAHSGEDEGVEVLVSRVYPTYVTDSNTYICMIVLVQKGMEGVEGTPIPLHQFLQAFEPVGQIEFDRFQA